MDSNKIMGLIRMKGLRVTDLLDKMEGEGVEMSKSTFYKTIRGERQINAAEIRAMSKAMNLSQDEVMDIFFKELVS